MGTALNLAGFVGLMSAVTWYFLTINRERVPVAVGGFNAACAAGLAASAVGAVLAPTGLTITLGAISALIGGLIFYLMSIRRLPPGSLIARVGAPMPPLAATDQDGARLDLADLKGTRLMVKFFRGSW